MCDLYQAFEHVAYGRGSVLLRHGAKSQGEWAIWGVFPHWQSIVQHSVWDPHKKAEPIDMPFGMSILGPRNSVLRHLRGGDDPRRKRGNFGGNMCRQTYIYNCQLDWSVQRHTTGAECLIASVGRVLSATSGGYGLHTVGEVWISTMALFQLQHIAPSGNLFIYLFTKSTTEGPEGHWHTVGYIKIQTYTQYREIQKNEKWIKVEK